MCSLLEQSVENCGHFQLKDEAECIINVFLCKGQIYFQVKWKKTPYCTKTNTIFSYHELKKYNAAIILEFYEPRLHIYSKQVQNQAPRPFVKTQDPKPNQQREQVVQNFYQPNFSYIKKQPEEKSQCNKLQNQQRNQQAVEYQQNPMMQQQNHQIPEQHQNINENDGLEEKKIQSLNLKQLLTVQKNSLQNRDLLNFENDDNNDRNIRQFPIKKIKQQNKLFSNDFQEDNLMQVSVNGSMKEEQQNKKKQKEILKAKKNEKKTKKSKEKRGRKQKIKKEAKKSQNSPPQVANQIQNENQINQQIQNQEIIPAKYVLDYDLWRNRPNIKNYYIQKKPQKNKIILPVNVVPNQPVQQEYGLRRSTRPRRNSYNKRWNMQDSEEKQKIPQQNDNSQDDSRRRAYSISSRQNRYKKMIKKQATQKQTEKNPATKQNLNKSLDKSEKNASFAKKDTKAISKSISKTKPNNDVEKNQVNVPQNSRRQSNRIRSNTNKPSS